MTEQQSAQQPGQEPEEQSGMMSRRRFVVTAAGAAAVGTAVAAGIAVRELGGDDDGAGAVATATTATAERLVAQRSSGTAPSTPDDAAWDDVAPWVVQMQQQNLVTPFGPEVAVPELTVRAIHDGTDLAFLVEWSDSAQDDLDAMARFRDAVAVQLPVEASASPAVTMGQQGQPVHIMQWRASWQADIDLGRRGVKEMFPNMYHDAAPEDLMSEEDARQFYPALAVGNPMAQRERTSPVEDLVAVGFGSLTSHEEQTAAGDATFDGSGWHVVIRTPLQPGADKSSLAPGDTTSVAFAVWNGSVANRGSRKQWANWAPLELEA